MTASGRVRLLLDNPLPQTRDRVLSALRQRRLLGYVDAPDTGDVAATLHLVGDHLLVVSTSGSALTSGPSCQDLVQQLSAHTGVAVAVVDADGEPLALEEPHGRSPVEEPTEDADPEAAEEAVTLFVVRGDLAVSEARAAETARDVGCPVWLAPLGDGQAGVVVVAEGVPDDVVPWLPAQRPVLRLDVTAGGFASLAAYLRADAKSARLREKLVAWGTPGHGWLVAPSPTAILPGEALVRLSQEDQARVRSAQAADPTAEMYVAPLAEELDLGEQQTEELRRVLATPWSPTTVSDLTRSLGLPREVATLLEGGAASDLPGAVRGERLGFGRTVWASTLEPPTGDSWWKRYQRLPHTRPALAVTLTVLSVALGVVALALGLSEGHPWDGPVGSVVLLVLGALLLLEAASEGVLHVALARRRRAA